MEALRWIALVLGLVVTIMVLLAWLGQWRWNTATRGLMARLAAAQVSPRPQRYSSGELEGLPAPVQRYLRRALTEGQPMVSALDMVHAGSFNLRETGEQWRPFRSRQRVLMRRPGFVWDGRISLLPGLAVRVHDAYVAGEGILHPAILGLLTLANLRDDGDLARSELMRFLAEAPWYPTALLPSQGVQWEPIDESSARATLRDGALAATLTFHFGADAMIEAVGAVDRARTVGGKLVATPWEGRWYDVQRRDGMLVPMRGEVAWLTPQGRRPYWRGSIAALRYTFAG